MHGPIAKTSLLLLSLFMLVSLACDMSVTVVAPTSLPATPAPGATAAVLEPSFEGVEVTVDPLSVVLPSQLAIGARGVPFSRVEGEEVAPWEVTPGHIQLKLEGYALQDRLPEPQIYVYPAQAYAEMYPPAFESIHRLNNILYPPGGPDLNSVLPAVPFFNAQQLFASNTQLISFQNGQGVRFLTQYAQYPASANNHDLFYHFQGVTRDGTYYIVAILPVRAPTLAETSDAGAPLPVGGVPYPLMADPNANMQAYYASVVDVLNATPAEAFTPALSQLDALIQSMQITP